MHSQKVVTKFGLCSLHVKHVYKAFAGDLFQYYGDIEYMYIYLYFDGPRHAATVDDKDENLICFHINI